MGSRILPETTVGKHNPPCYLQMPTKALSCRKESTCEHGPEAPSCPVGQGSFKMFQSGKVVRRVQTKTFLLEVTDAVSSGLKNFQRVISVQLIGQHLWWYGEVHKCIQYGHVFEGTNAERYIMVLEQHVLPSRGRVFQQDNAKPHTAAITTAWLRSRRVRCWICLQSRSFTNREYLVHH